MVTENPNKNIYVTSVTSVTSIYVMSHVRTEGYVMVVSWWGVPPDPFHENRVRSSHGSSVARPKIDLPMRLGYVSSPGPRHSTAIRAEE